MPKLRIINDLSYMSAEVADAKPRQGDIEYTSVGQSAVGGWRFVLPSGARLLLPASVAILLNGGDAEDA